MKPKIKSFYLEWKDKPEDGFIYCFEIYYNEYGDIIHASIIVWWNNYNKSFKTFDKNIRTKKEIDEVRIQYQDMIDIGYIPIDEEYINNPVFSGFTTDASGNIHIHN